jgi:hypothetical protein
MKAGTHYMLIIDTSPEKIMFNICTLLFIYLLEIRLHGILLQDFPPKPLRNFCWPLMPSFS